jgi:hypothetical protein
MNSLTYDASEYADSSVSDREAQIGYNINRRVHSRHRACIVYARSLLLLVRNTIIEAAGWHDRPVI